MAQHPTQPITKVHVHAADVAWLKAQEVEAKAAAAWRDNQESDLLWRAYMEAVAAQEYAWTVLMGAWADYRRSQAA